MELNNQDRDFFIKGHLDIEQLRAGYAAASRDARDLLEVGEIGWRSARTCLPGGARYSAGQSASSWARTASFYRAHLAIAGRYHAMGVTLGGFPLVVIGFKRDQNA